MNLKPHGQAIIEYIFIFSAFSLIAIQAAKGVGNYSQDMFRSLSYALTQELTVGVCSDADICWHTQAYENRIKQ
ncbi:MAG: hypothetical protein VX341_04210 [Bdellovibrionota bacterium]|nr:hypothetical protein [Bdellovibrionota bacterium]|tara:strand:+ start:122 stop:343 length:222 start_codon:yes stop_codon:yes gene_type:complete